MRWMTVVWVILMLASPVYAGVFLEDSAGVVVACQGKDASALTCNVKKERLALYVKCHEQMQDAMKVMHQFAPGYSNEPQKNPPADRQDDAVTYWRETMQRCVGR